MTMTARNPLDVHRRDAATRAGYGEHDTPCEPRRSAYTDGHPGDVAFGLAMSRWIRYNEAIRVRVFNLDTDEYVGVYTCSPREAVIAAHAQSVGSGDFNTWDYERAWGHLVTETEHVVTCGSMSARVTDA